MRRAFLAPLAVALAAAALAGCLGDEADPGAGTSAAPGSQAAVAVVDEAGEPVAFPQATLLDASGDAVVTRSGGPNGTITLSPAPAGAEAAVVTAPDRGTARVGLDDVPASLELPAEEEAPPPSDGTPVLDFLDPDTLGTAHLGGQEETCNVYNCGASEPVLEVAGDGTIYASGTCCIGESPPIWYSEDGGATWERLEGDALRDNYGIEGDFAIDGDGNLYFSDISVASGFFASWDADQEHRHTIPAGPFAPIVDRPWVRAGAEDQVYFAYNRGTDTAFYTSSDGGITWTFQRLFPVGLGNLGQGPEEDHLWLAGGGQIWESRDGGETWSGPEDIPEPSTDGERFMSYSVPVADADGNLWVAYDWRTTDDEGNPEDTAVYLARRSPDGTWSGPWMASPEEGTHHLPWPAAGESGKVGLAWYGTLDDEAGPNAVDRDARWRAYAAVTLDGDAGAPNLTVSPVDPRPVHQGPMDRKLLDFLQAEIGPAGALHVAYAADPGGRPDEVTRYARTTTGLSLAPSSYFNGP
jgi:hypothetical protein